MQFVRWFVNPVNDGLILEEQMSIRAMDKSTRMIGYWGGILVIRKASSFRDFKTGQATRVFEVFTACVA
jgi:hypothetical protein